jgi:hypothetical protein
MENVQIVSLLSVTFLGPLFSSSFSYSNYRQTTIFSNAPIDCSVRNVIARSLISIYNKEQNYLKSSGNSTGQPHINFSSNIWFS